MTETKLHLTLVRHGNTNGNRMWIVEGHTDGPLNSTGKHQAKLVAERLKNEHFDYICSSDLSRAFETASAIAKENTSFYHERRIEKCKELRERHFGVAEKTMILQHYHNAKKEGFKRSDLTRYVPEGGESDDEVRERVRIFLNNLLKKCASSKDPDLSVLIVSHGITMREIVRCFIEDYGCTGLSNEVMLDGKRLAKTPNTGVTQFSLVLNDETSNVISGKCTLFQCKRHLEPSNELIRKFLSFWQGVVEFFEFLFVLILYLLAKYGL